MKLLETIEDGHKAAIFWEGIDAKDSEAIHAYQLNGGEGTLVVSKGAIRFHPAPRNP